MPDAMPGPSAGSALREVERLTAELNALRDENDSLRQEAQELRADLRLDKKNYDDFITEVAEMLPPSYDEDAAIESIVIRFLTDMQSLAQVIAKLTTDYRQ